MIPRVSPKRRARRRTKAERKRANPERYCAEKRCYRPPLHIARCGSHATAYLDGLWSKLVRARGACESCGATANLQGAHGFSRTYRATRWVLLNGFCLCRACHVKYTHDPLGWDDYLRRAWGALPYEEMRARVAGWSKPDYDAARVELEGA